MAAQVFEASNQKSSKLGAAISWSVGTAWRTTTNVPSSRGASMTANSVEWPGTSHVQRR